jgi:hypothetical protein
VPPASCIEEHPISCISNLWSCFKICDITTAKEDQSHEGWERQLLRPFQTKDLTKLSILLDNTFPHMLCIALRPRQTRLISKDLLNKKVAEGRAQPDWTYEFPDRTGPARPD